MSLCLCEKAVLRGHLPEKLRARLRQLSWFSRDHLAPPFKKKHSTRENSDRIGAALDAATLTCTVQDNK